MIVDARAMEGDLCIHLVVQFLSERHCAAKKYNKISPLPSALSFPYPPTRFAPAEVPRRTLDGAGVQWNLIHNIATDFPAKQEKLKR